MIPQLLDQPVSLSITEIHLKSNVVSHRLVELCSVNEGHE